MDDEGSTAIIIMTSIIGAVGLSQWLPKLMPRLFVGWQQSSRDKQEHSQAIETKLLEQFLEDRQNDGEWQKKTLVSQLIDIEKRFDLLTTKLNEITTYQYQLDRDQTAIQVELKTQITNDMVTIERTLTTISQSILGLYDLVGESGEAQRAAMARELNRNHRKRRHAPKMDDLLNSASRANPRNPKVDTGEFEIQGK